MNDRPDWMPSEAVAGETMKEHTYEAHERAVSALCHSAGLRAQIAVLENVYSEDHPDEVCENIEYKIAALRKELEG